MSGLGMRRVPFDKAHGRDYRKEYDNFQGQPEQLKNRALRNAARSSMKASGKARLRDGKDVDHKRSIKSGGTNTKGNLRVLAKAKNRGFPRNSENKPTGEA
jgi:hypothetical protein